MAAYPNDWAFELFINLNCFGFTVIEEPEKIFVEGEFYPADKLPVADRTDVEWYLDAAYTVKATENSFAGYISDPEDTVGVTYGSLTLYGKVKSVVIPSTNDQKARISFKQGIYDSSLFDNANENCLSHNPGTLYLAKLENFTNAHLFYDDGRCFLNVTPVMTSQFNGGVGLDMSIFPTYSTLIQGTDFSIDFVASQKGAYYSTAASALPQFGTLPVSCGGTGNTTFTAYRPVYVSSTTKLASATSHYMSTTKFAVGTVTAPSTTFYVNGSTGLSGTLAVGGDTTLSGALEVTGDSTFGDMTINGVINSGIDVMGNSSFAGTITVNNNTYGTDLPATGTEGQVFFKLV